MEQKLIKDFEIPNKKIETWKFTDLKKVFEKNNFKPFIKPPTKVPSAITINTDISNNIFFNPEINFVIFENGYLQKFNKKSDGLEITTLNDSLEKKTI